MAGVMPDELFLAPSLKFACRAIRSKHPRCLSLSWCCSIQTLQTCKPISITAKHSIAALERSCDFLAMCMGVASLLCFIDM